MFAYYVHNPVYLFSLLLEQQIIEKRKGQTENEKDVMENSFKTLGIPRELEENMGSFQKSLVSFSIYPSPNVAVMLLLELVKRYEDF